MVCSVEPRDIVFELEYQGAKDTVRATAVGVVLKKAYYTRATSGNENKVPDNLDSIDLRNSIKEDQAADGSYYGFGSCTAVGSVDTRFGGRILFEWEIIPQKAEEWMTDIGVVGVLFDVTRQIMARDYAIQSGEHVMTPLTKPEQTMFPERQSPQRDNEMPNDNKAFRYDEDNAPSNSLIYSYDSPTQPNTTDDAAFSIRQNTLREWVRMKLDRNIPFQHDDRKILQDVQGSQVSLKKDWHCVYHLVRNPEGKWREDDADTTYSSPLRTTEGNGRIDITLGKDAITEGFKASYGDAFSRRIWLLTGTKSGLPVSDSDYVPDGYWKLAFPNTITVEIWQGMILFADDDRFNFSIFRKYRKENKIGLGFFDVTK